MLLYLLDGHKWKCRYSVLGSAYRISFRLIFGIKFFFLMEEWIPFTWQEGQPACRGTGQGARSPSPSWWGRSGRDLPRAAPAELPGCPLPLWDVCGDVEEWRTVIPTKRFIYYTVKIYEILTPSSATNKFGASNGYLLYKRKTVFILTI